MIATLTLLMMLALSLPALAANRYVSKTGNLTNNCTLGASCLTITRGAQQMAGGDTLLIGPGTYAERQIPVKSGSSGSPTTIRAETPGTVIVKWPGVYDTNRNMFSLPNGGQWIVIDGITMDASDASGNLGIGYIINADDLSDTIVRNSVMSNSFATCWLAARSYRITLEDSTLINCGFDNDLDHAIYWGGGSGHIVQRNTFIASAGFNIQLRDFVAGPFTITRNRLTGSRLGTVLTGANIIFMNNFVWDDAWSGPSESVYAGFGVSTKVWNNTFLNNGMYFRNDSSGTHEFYNNIHTGTNSVLKIDENQTVLTENSNLTSDPGFIDASSGDLHLANGTNAAINTGRNIAGVTVDIDGNARPVNQYDKGADEFGGTTSTVYHLALGTPPNSSTHVGEVMVFHPSFEIHNASHTIQTAGALGTTTITLSLIQQPASGVMSGTLAKAATAGVVEYTDLTFNVPGTYQFRATATLPNGVQTADSDPFVVLALVTPVPTSLLFVTQPGDTPVGATMAPVVVRVRDQDGAPYTTASVSVNLQIAANPASGVLSGTRPINTLAGTGQATFTDLSISAAVPANAVGTPYTVQASIAGPITATSSPFAVLTPPPAPGHSGARQTRAMFLAR